jgi:hypothetical protein
MSRELKTLEAPTEEVNLFWEVANVLNLRSTPALYLLTKRGGRKVMYIGKAVSQTVRSRLLCASKERLSKKRVECCVLVAAPHTSRNVTKKLVDDIERLLIFLVQPEWNRVGKQSCRLHHRELIVNCDGKWPLRQHQYYCLDEFPFELHYRSE